MARARPEPITVEALNQLYREFWASQETPREEPSTHPGIAVLMREAHRLEVRAAQELHALQAQLRTEAATRERRDRGNASRDAVYLSAKRITQLRGPMSRTRLARLVASDIGISTEHTRRLLRETHEK